MDDIKPVETAPQQELLSPQQSISTLQRVNGLASEMMALHDRMSRSVAKQADYLRHNIEMLEQRRADRLAACQFEDAQDKQLIESLKTMLVENTQGVGALKPQPADVVMLPAESAARTGWFGRKKRA